VSAVGLSEGVTVPHDRRKRVRLAADVALRVAVVLVRDHYDEREEQPEQRGDDAQEL
jgi:hypothetical protein